MSIFALLCLCLAVTYAAPPGAAAEVPENLGAILSPSFGLIDFAVMGKQFAFDARGTLQILNDNNILYLSEGGIYYNAGAGYVAPPVPNSVNLPDLDTQLPAADIKLAATEWVLSSGLWAFEKNGLLDVTIKPADLPASLPLKLSTDSPFWLQVMPGLTKYPHLNLTLTITPNTPWPAIAITPNNTATIGPLAFELTVDIVRGDTVVLPTAVVLQLDFTLAISFAVSIADAGQSISTLVTLNQLTDTESVISSKVGAVNLVSLKTLIEFASHLLHIPPIVVPVPTGFTLTALNVQTKPGYVYALVTAKTS